MKMQKVFFRRMLALYVTKNGAASLMRLLELCSGLPLGIPELYLSGAVMEAVPQTRVICKDAYRTIDLNVFIN